MPRLRSLRPPPVSSLRLLGLAIVRSLVEENAGRISVTSALGEGTVFTLVLPAGPAS